MENYLSLEELYNDFKEREEKKINFINDSEKKYYGFLSLAGINEELALHAIYVLQDFDEARNYFYKAAVSGEYMVRIYDELMHTSIYKICYALLSDSRKVIEHYSTLRNKEWNENFIGHQFNAAIQSVLLNNDEELARQIDAIKTNVAKKARNYVGYVDVFEGLLLKNRSQIEHGLQDLLQKHGKRDEFGLAKEYISFDASALAKLAWRQGIEVEITSPLVPKEMLPIKELDHYDGYDFFKEIGY